MSVASFSWPHDMSGADFVVAVFSQAKGETLVEAATMLRETWHSCKLRCLVGTHGDVDDLEVSEEEVKDFAAKLQCGYHLVSCRTGAGVDEAFADVLSQCLDLRGMTARTSPVQTEGPLPADGVRRCQCQVM